MYRDPYKPVTKTTKSKGKRERPKSKKPDPPAAFHDEGGPVPAYDDVALEPDPENAEKARADAIELAMADKLANALPLFERAVKLAPDNAFYLSDLGVTYLRLNYLDKAKETLDKANEMAPGQASILENLKAVLQHLDHRAGVLEDKEADEFAANIMEVPIDGAPAIHAKPFEKAGLYDDDEEAEEEGEINENKNFADLPSDWFGPWYFNATLQDSIAKHIQSNRPVVIKNVFRDDYAEKLWRELHESNGWEEYNGFEEYYQFNLHAMYHGTKPFRGLKVANQAYDFLDSAKVKDWAQEVTNSVVDGPTNAGVTWYQANDYTMPYTDFVGGRNKRRLAFVIHMTKDWNTDLGGDLVFTNPTYHIPPGFNTMTIFPVSQDAWHFVSPVARHCPKDMKRMTLSGWWTSTNLEEVKNRFAEDENRKRQMSFAMNVNGRDAKLLPFKPLQG